MTIITKQPLKVRKISRNPYFRNLPWASCLPFIDNRLAKLIHRPRSVETVAGVRGANFGVTFWCGNTVNGTDKFTFLNTLPESGKLLCARCEENAVASGMPSAEDLNGHHVHLGRLKAIRTCCKVSES